MILTLNGYFAQGTNAERLLYVPDPTMPAVGPLPNVMWQNTDDGDLWYWDFVGGAWVATNPGGSVTTVSVASANGFAGSVANPTTTPAITISTSVTGILYGNGTAVAAAIAANFPTLNQNTTGSAATLTTPRNINGVAFNGSADITVTAAASTLTGTTLAAAVVTSSLTAVGTIATGVWQGTAVGAIYGGTGITSYTTGDLLYASATNVLSKLAATTNTFVLTLTGGVPVWAAASSGGTPGGSTTQLQYNNAGAFGGISGVTTDGTNMTAGSGNLRATSPRFTTSIFDTNGLPILGLSAAASSVSYLTLVNAGSGFNPNFQVTSSDSNVGIALIPKGTGQLAFGVLATSVNQAITASAVFYNPTASAASTMLLQTADSSSSFTCSEFYLERSRGTLASPSGISSGDRLGMIRFGAYSNAWQPYYTSILVESTEAWSGSSALGANMIFSMPANGSATSRQVLKLAATSGTAGSWTCFGDVALICGSTTSLTLTTTTAVFVGTVATAAPAGASAHPWLLGSVVSGAVTLDATNSVYVTINGTVKKLLIAA